MRFKQFFSAALLVLLAGSGSVSANDEFIYLAVDFDDRTVGETLGTGGAENGEPILIYSGLEALIVQNEPGDNVLRVERADPTSTSSKTIRWELLDDAEITSGVVAFTFRLVPPALDNYTVYIREQGGSAKTFLSLNFTTSGTIKAVDAANTAANPIATGTYVAGTALDLFIEFDMDEGTSAMWVNDIELFSGQEHGISDRGVGRIMFGFASGSYPEGTTHYFELDDLEVFGDAPPPNEVFDDGFEQPILSE